MAPRGESAWDDRVAASWSAASAGAASVLWLAVWWHQQRTHGTTSVNEMKLALGLTWMDSGKVLPLAFLLLAPGVAVVTSRAGRTGNRAAFVTGQVVLALLVASVVLGVVLKRTGVLPVAMALVLAAGFAGTFFLTPVFLVPAAAWLVLALWVWPGRPWPRRSASG